MASRVKDQPGGQDARRTEWLPFPTAPTDGSWFVGYRVATRSRPPLCAVGCINPLGEFEESTADWQPRGTGFYPTHWMPLPDPPK